MSILTERRWALSTPGRSRRKHQLGREHARDNKRERSVTVNSQQRDGQYSGGCYDCAATSRHLVLNGDNGLSLTIDNTNGGQIGQNANISLNTADLTAGSLNVLVNNRNAGSIGSSALVTLQGGAINIQGDSFTWHHQPQRWSRRWHNRRRCDR